MKTSLGASNSMRRMNATWRGQYNHISLGGRQQRFDIRVTVSACRIHCGLQSAGFNIANIDKLGIACVLLDGTKMVFRDTTATDQGEADFSIQNGRGVHVIKVSTQ
jgi:hypothetical protein